MATWLAHLRIAENILSYGFELPIEPFLVGNIAPDATINDGKGGWIPHKDITHWRDANHFQAEDFYDAYIRDKEIEADLLAFYMGYYAHIVADIEWIANIWQPLIHANPELTTKLMAEPDFALEIKKDWYGQDFIYLNENPDNVFNRVFKHIETVPDYLDYFPANAFTMAVERIKDYYKNSESMQLSLNHQYKYMSKFDMEGWVHSTSSTLIGLFNDREIACLNPRPLSAFCTPPDA
jgi:hypothetical protein